MIDVDLVIIVLIILGVGIFAIRAKYPQKYEEVKETLQTTGKILEPISINNYLETHPFRIGMLLPLGLALSGLIILMILV